MSELEQVSGGSILRCCRAAPPLSAPHQLCDPREDLPTSLHLRMAICLNEVLKRCRPFPQLQLSVNPPVAVGEHQHLRARHPAQIMGADHFGNDLPRGLQPRPARDSDADSYTSAVVWRCRLRDEPPYLQLTDELGRPARSQRQRTGYLTLPKTSIGGRTKQIQQPHVGQWDSCHQLEPTLDRREQPYRGIMELVPARLLNGVEPRQLNWR